jgi:hypothetical protein
MGQFFLHEGSGNDANGLAVLLKDGIGQNAHQADMTAPEDQAQPAPDHLLA